MNIGKLHENKDLRNILLAVAVIMVFIFIVSSAIYFIKEHYGLSCSCKLSLPIVIAALTSLGVFVGILTYYFLSKSFSKEKKIILGNVEKTLSFLEEEEKDIILALIQSRGAVAQSSLNRMTRINPVKVHRRLLNLESKGVIHKVKTGMTNKIVLDDDFKRLFIK